MSPRTTRILAASMVLAALLASVPAVAAKLPAPAAADSQPSLDDLAGPPSTRFT